MIIYHLPPIKGTRNSCWIRDVIGTWAWWCVIYQYIISLDHDISRAICSGYTRYKASVHPGLPFCCDQAHGPKSNSWGWGRLRRHWMVVPQPMCKHGCPLPLRYGHLSDFGLTVRKFCMEKLCYHQITHDYVITLDPQWELVILRVVMDCGLRLLLRN